MSNYLSLSVRLADLMVFCQYFFCKQWYQISITGEKLLTLGMCSVCYVHCGKEAWLQLEFHAENTPVEYTDSGRYQKMAVINMGVGFVLSG